MPLMTLALPLYKMMLGAQHDGTVLTLGALHDSEIVQRIEEAMKESDAMFLILGHPMMCLDMI
jgi:predicted dinucleotide-utilizing enzyme